jgi:L-aminopeptidase/D-esterase-like protein
VSSAAAAGRVRARDLGFVQANFGKRDELTLAGVPVGRLVIADDPMAEFSLAPEGSGSVIAIVCTNAPLLPGQCKALARRVTLGLARTSTTGSHYSGDLFLAFSTGNVLTGGFGDAVCRQLRDNDVDVIVRTVGLPRQFLGHGTRDEILAEAGLTSVSLTKVITGLIARLGPARAPAGHG